MGDLPSEVLISANDIVAAVEKRKMRFFLQWANGPLERAMHASGVYEV